MFFLCCSNRGGGEGKKKDGGGLKKTGWRADEPTNQERAFKAIRIAGSKRGEPLCSVVRQVSPQRFSHILAAHAPSDELRTRTTVGRNTQCVCSVCVRCGGSNETQICCSVFHSYFSHLPTDCDRRCNNK